MPVIRPAAAALLALAAPTVAAGAQSAVTLDLATTSVEYGDSLRASAMTIAPSVRLQSGAFALQATGLLARFGTGDLSSQGAVEGSALLPAMGPLRLELRGDAGGSAHQDNTRTGQYLGGARLHLANGERGAWIGGGAGRVWDGATWYPLSVAELAGWTRLGAVTAFASARPTSMDSIRYTDVEGALGWTRGRLELGAALGTRSGVSRIPGDRSVWGSARAMLRLGGPLAVVAAGGTYPVDYTQGYPGGRFVSVGLRLAPAPRAAEPLVRRERPLHREGLALAIGSEREGTRVVRVRAADARQVEIAGDFTDWRPVALARDARGWWTVRLPLAPGAHQFNVRVDGGAWQVPEGVTAITDEFGGAVGVIVVQ